MMHYGGDEAVRTGRVFLKSIDFQLSRGDGGGGAEW